MSDDLVKRLRSDDYVWLEKEGAYLAASRIEELQYWVNDAAEALEEATHLLELATGSKADHRILNTLKLLKEVKQ